MIDRLVCADGGDPIPLGLTAGTRRKPSGSGSTAGLSAHGPAASLGRYARQWKPYATSREELDADHTVQEEARNAARTLLEAITAGRAGRFASAGSGLEQPRQK